MVDPDRLATVNLARQEQVDDLAADLRAAGYTVAVLDGGSVVDKATFLSAASRAWPLEEELTGPNWDAYVDYLRGGLGRLPGARVALIWTHTERMLDGGLADLLIAVDITAAVLNEAISRTEGWPAIAAGHLFLAGLGPNFTWRTVI